MTTTAWRSLSFGSSWRDPCIQRLSLTCRAYEVRNTYVQAACSPSKSTGLQSCVKKKSRPDGCPRRVPTTKHVASFATSSAHRLDPRQHPSQQPLARRIPPNNFAERSRRAPPHHLISTRPFSTGTLTAILTPPAVFVGLILSLWAYKCLMMIIFQDKIIYMPSVPPFSRSEKLEAYAREFGSVRWREERIASGDGVGLGVAVGELGGEGATTGETGDSPGIERQERVVEVKMDGGKGGRKNLILLYFQGNASSLPPRTPLLSSVMRETLTQYHHQHQLYADHENLAITLLALSYRGFWTSSGRPSQPGIELDAAAALSYARSLCATLAEQGEDVHLVVWGQSIGCGVATTAVANALKSPEVKGKTGKVADIEALILETPFLSIRHMLTSLYPQKWLPYRYLWPFLRNWWDSEAALRMIAARCSQHSRMELDGGRGRKPKVLVLNADKDEVVPADQGRDMVRAVEELGFESESADVKGALHHEVCVKGEGRREIASFLRGVIEGQTGDAAEHGRSDR